MCTGCRCCSRVSGGIFIFCCHAVVQWRSLLTLASNPSLEVSSAAPQPTQTSTLPIPRFPSRCRQNRVADHSMSSPMVMRLSRPALRPSHLCLALCILLDPLHAFNPQLPSSSFHLHRTAKRYTAFSSSCPPHFFTSAAAAATVARMHPRRCHVLAMDAASAGGWPPYHGDSDDSSTSSSGGNSGLGSSSGGSEFGGTGSSSDISPSPSSAANVPASFPPPPPSFFNPDFDDDDENFGTHKSEDSNSDSASSSSNGSRNSGCSTLGGRVPWIEVRVGREEGREGGREGGRKGRTDAWSVRRLQLASCPSVSRRVKSLYYSLPSSWPSELWCAHPLSLLPPPSPSTLPTHPQGLTVVQSPRLPP